MLSAAKRICLILASRTLPSAKVAYDTRNKCVWWFYNRYVLGIDEAEAFSERLKRELTALEAANVHAILESEPLVEEVVHEPLPLAPNFS